MKTITKATKYVIFVSLVYLIVLVICIIFGMIKLPEISKIFLSLGAGLIGWLITHLFTKWIAKDEENLLKKVENDFHEYIDSKFPPHNSDTNRVLCHILEQNGITVMETRRKKVGYDSLKNFFNNAKTVKISGIACKALIEDLLNKDDHALLTALRNRSGVMVDILICDPDSEHIKLRDSFEYRDVGTAKNCSDGIRYSISNVEKLRDKLNESVISKTKQGSILQIRKTRMPLSNTLNYVEYLSSNSLNDLKEKMLIGFLFSHIQGDNSLIYEVSKTDKTNSLNDHFRSALESFTGIYRDDCTSSLLIWDHNGTR